MTRIFKEVGLGRPYIHLLLTFQDQIYQSLEQKQFSILRRSLETKNILNPIFLNSN